MRHVDVDLANASYGMMSIVAHIGRATFHHNMLFLPEHQPRAEEHAAALEDLLLGAEDDRAAIDLLDPKLWKGPGKSAHIWMEVFQP